MPGDLLSYASEAMSISEKTSFRWGIAVSKYASGFYHYAKRDYDEALENISGAQEIWESYNDKKNAGRCMYLRANIQYDRGDYTGSVKNCMTALANWDACGYKLLKGPCCNDLALSYARTGDYSKGVEFAYKGFQASEQIADKKEMAQSLHLMGWLFYEFSNYENAMKNFEAASLIYQELGDDFGFARNNNMIGEILLDEGKASEAFGKFNQSLTIYQGPGAPAWGIPWGYSNIGSVREKQGDSAIAAGAGSFGLEKYQEALKHFSISLEKFTEIRDQAGVAEQNIFIGEIYFKLGQLPVAKKHLLNGLSIAGRAGEKKNLETCYLYLSRIDSAEGNTRLAYEHYKQYVLYKDSIFNMQSSQNLSLYKTQLEFEKKDHQITLLATENKLKTTLAEKQNLRKKFAYGIIAAVVLLGLFSFYRYRRQSKINAEKKLLKERLAISQDLHDHVGSTLSSISVFSKVAQVQGEKGNKSEMNELLERIQDTSGKMMTEMNDIVWAINPHNDTMEKIIQRMESYAKPVLTARNIQFTFSCDDAALQLNLEMEQRKNFYLIFKEAVNNAIKYSGASMLESSIIYKQGFLELLVKDNGVGFNPYIELEGSRSLSGNGLKNIRARAREMDAELIIDSALEKGTSIRLVLPVAWT